MFSGGEGECTEEEDKGSEDQKGHHDALFNSLMQECKYSAPGARLSAKLRTALERLSPGARRAVCERTREGCAPLFVASRRGNVEIVEYLVHVCAVDIEQRGRFEVPDERSVHTVTPLWCAAVSGRVGVVRSLADAGADLDAPSDSGSTAVRSACFMSHADVVRLLVERGADIHRPNHNGGTCLINSVQSVRLCEFLLDRGADADARDTQLKTVLHYAIQEHRLETARLLLERGANPHLRSRAGDDALRTASLKGAAQIVRLLATRVRYSAERLADAHELLGATLLDEFNDVSAALAAWRRGTTLRHAAGGYVRKRGWVPAEGGGRGGGGEWGEWGERGETTEEREAARLALAGAREWVSLRELQALGEEVEALRMQALLVTTRVLGPDHKDSVFRIMYRGAGCADAGRYERCVHLWSWALAVRLRRDTVLHGESAHAASALARLLVQRGARREDVLRVFTLVARRLPEGMRLLAVRPRSRAQADAYERALRCVTHVALVLVRAGGGRRALAALVAEGVRSAHTGDTLLHLAVSRLNVLRVADAEEEADAEGADAEPVFPSVELVRALLECGARVDAVNEARSTALHVAAIPYNFSTELVELLLEHGAHLDQPNRFGDSAAELVVLNRRSRVRVLQHVSLRCLAARAALRAAGSGAGWGALPHTLRDFLRLHTP